jgi:phosphodiesterase/alkaline phosphatase D-like protein
MLKRSLIGFSSFLVSTCSGEPGERIALHKAPLHQQQGGDTIEAGDKFGAVLAVGNFNNDNYADLVVGAPGEDSNAGAISLFKGSSTGLENSGIVIKQSHTSGGTNIGGDRFGAAIATGDLNGDGRDDLVVGIPGKDTESGAIAVYLSSSLHGPTGIDRTKARFFFVNSFGCGSKTQRDDFGWALAIGDFNADSYEDLAIGSPGKNSDTGAVCVVKGRATTGIDTGLGASYNRGTVQYPVKLIPPPPAEPPKPNPVLGAIPGQRFGAALATGRLTNDSNSDLVVGAPGVNADAIALFGRGDSTTPVGEFFKTQTDPMQASAVALLSQTAGDDDLDRFGEVVLVANLTQDGYDDVIVGAPNENTAKSSTRPGETIAGAQGGAVFVFHSKSDGTGPDSGAWYQQSGSVAGAGSENGDKFGAALAAGDFDGNLQVDLAVGSPNEGPSSQPDTSGMVSILPGSPAGLEVGAYYAQEDLSGNSEAGDLMGAALAAADFDNNGFADLAVGYPGEAPSSDPAGGYVFVKMGAAAPTSISVGPILGAVTDDSVKVWVRASKATTFRVAYTPAGGAETLDNETLSLTQAKDFTGAVTLTGLAANTFYSYRVLLGGVQKFTGTFRTLPVEQAPGQVVFTYGADFKLDFRPYVLATQAAADQPHFMILGGDNIYADRFASTPNTKAGYEARYRQTFADGPLRSLMQKVPTFMMWDDHDIRNNWPEGSTDFYPVAHAAFKEYQGSHGPNPADADPVYYSFRAGEVDFFMLDTRSYRPTNCEKTDTACANDATRSMLDGSFNPAAPGPQYSALIQWLDTSWAKFKIIVSSVAFDDLISTTDHDSWRGFRAERERIFQYIVNEGIGGVVLLTGDQHWTGAFVRENLAPYKFHEFLATPMGVDTRDKPTGLVAGPPSGNNSRVLYVNDQYRGYARFTANTMVTPSTLKFDWIVDTAGQPCPTEPQPPAGVPCVAFTRTITTSDISPW